ncbi:hypothetical protein BJ138DRAFT_1114430 [Hygrophoropsis aurantiaca]|uniref:Uncharacterized protein n=1 Tax=Hygrophoropsis aurantiaca TaxID=72124 RepID=A0ACB8AAF5_9AGAM|nr:hypothetical protein BJ138DRAFT_1114430 [Hygrophoropsis aurantiaca]
MSLSTWDIRPSLPIPLDVLFDIIVYLPLKSILTLRQTSKSFFSVTQLRSLWALLLRIHVLQKNLPILNFTDASISSLDTPSLESAVCRALALRRSWSSSSPKHTRHIDIIKGAEPDSRVIFLSFLPGRENRWLISVSMTARPRKFIIQCWDVSLETPRCVAKLKHIDGPYGGVVINSDPTSPAMLVMQFAHTETFTIDLLEEDPESAFVTIHIIDGIREIHLLSSSTLVTRTSEGEISVWDLDTSLEREKLQLTNPVVPPTEKCLAMHKYEEYLLLFRAQTIETYSLTPTPTSNVASRRNSLPKLSTRSPPVHYPLTQHRWQWRADNVVISEQHQYQLNFTHRSPPPINIFIRFGSIYPWPVNILHHFSLVPNPTYVPGAASHSPASTSHTASNLVPPMETLMPPYLTEPRAVQTIASPVRLFSQSAVVLGQYGSALWLDSHTEDWFGPSDRGQRLAGKMLSVDGEDVGDSSSIEESNNHSDAQDSGGEGEQGMQIRREMMFGVQEDDMWSRVAMDEESGRVVLGCVNGDIEMFEYA